MKLNCLGDMCPVPLLKADAAMKHMPENGSLLVITDHSCTVESLADHFPPPRYALDIEEPINGVWEVTITKKNVQANGQERRAKHRIRLLRHFHPSPVRFSKSS